MIRYVRFSKNLLHLRFKIEFMEDFKDRLRIFLKKLLKFSMKNRYILLEVDLLLGIVSFVFAVFIHSQLLKATYASGEIVKLGVVYTFISFLGFVFFKSNRGLVRHSNFLEFWRLYISLLIGILGVYCYMLITGFSMQYRYFFIQNLFLIDLFWLLFARFAMVMVYNFSISYNLKVAKNTLIYSTSSHSIALMQWLNKTASMQYHVVGFITREKLSSKMRIQDLPVYYLEETALPYSIFRKHNINTVIFPDYKSLNKEQDCISKCIEMGMNVLVSPPFEGLNENNKIRFQMKPIQFEDLLGRDEIKINLENVAMHTNNKVILITGGAGSIGSELVRQLAAFKPELIVVFDIAETPLHNLRLELKRKFPEFNFEAIVGDVRNKERLEFVFKKYKPQIIYHAAAYKHVPLMEENPCEAILTNVEGTINLSNMAVKYNVENFVMISTDKAVNPTNIMGASKRIAEIYIQSLAQKLKNQGRKINFVTTRFGNVLGSNGSVIPFFKEQIEKGGPVSVTHPDIIRYFMTIPEACRLVMEAASFGRTGEIYVFDMGSPVKIADLARRMIELAGFVPNKDIMIEYIGLRQGEKLYEELLNDKENTIPTSHEKITIAKVRQYDYEEVLASIEPLLKKSSEIDIKHTVKLMKSIVPEFISQNSPFEELDNNFRLNGKQKEYAEKNQ